MSRTNDTSDFGQELARQRLAAGLSQRAVGDLLKANGGDGNKTGSAIGEWERGTSKPNPRDAAALERILGGEAGSLTALLYGSGPGVTERLAAVEERLERIEVLLRQLVPRPKR